MTEFLNCFVDRQYQLVILTVSLITLRRIITSFVSLRQWNNSVHDSSVSILFKCHQEGTHPVDTPFMLFRSGQYLLVKRWNGLNLVIMSHTAPTPIYESWETLGTGWNLASLICYSKKCGLCVKQHKSYAQMKVFVLSKYIFLFDNWSVPLAKEFSWNRTSYHLHLYFIFMARLTIVRGPYRFCPVRACIFCFHRKWYLWVSKRLLV